MLFGHYLTSIVETTWTEAFQLNDVSVQSLLIALQPILGCIFVNVLQQGKL